MEKNRRLIITLFLLTSVINFAYCQQDIGRPQIDKTSFNLLKEFSFTGQSEQGDIQIPVTGSIISLTLKISYMIKGGEILIEFYDPSGEKQGNYSFDNQNSLKLRGDNLSYNNSTDERLEGSILKSIDFPIDGIWKVSILIKKFVGNLFIDVKQETTKQILNHSVKR